MCWWCKSVVEHLPRMSEALSLIPGSISGGEMIFLNIQRWLIIFHHFIHYPKHQQIKKFIVTFMCCIIKYGRAEPYKADIMRLEIRKPETVLVGRVEGSLSHTKCAERRLLALCSRVAPGSASVLRGRPYVRLGTKLRLAACKASAIVL